MNLSEIQALLQTVRETGVAELSLEQGDFKLTIKQQVGQVIAATPIPVAAPAAAPTPVAETAPAPVAAEASPAVKALTINAPMVGSFYRSPSPEAAAFVEVGDMVKAGQTVCIIEAMKLMNEIEAEISGRVVRVLVSNGDPVEYGQPMLELEPV